MITDVGKTIIAKALSGVTDSCFDYLSLGIGARPMPPGTGAHQSRPLTQMDHEVLRVPIISAMPMNDGKIKCVAEIPPSFNCEFTEVGLWTHKENAGSNRPSSKQICSFVPNEGWSYNNVTPLKYKQEDNVATQSGDIDFAKLNALTERAAFSAYNDMLWTTKLDRRARKEGFRLDNWGILTRGDMSTITGASPAAWSVGGNYIRMNALGFNFDLSAAVDELGLAYFVSPNAAGSTTAPSTIQISIQFVTSDNKYAKWNLERKNQTALSAGTTTAGSPNITYTTGSTIVRRGDQLTGGGIATPTDVYPTSATAAKLGFLPTGTVGSGQSFSVNAFDLSITNGNAYYTDYIQLKETANARMAMTYDSGFKWSAVNEMRVYVSTGSNAHWIGLDSLTFTNVDNMNSTYGMTAYDIAYNYETRGVRTKENSPTNVLFEVSVV